MRRKKLVTGKEVCGRKLLRAVKDLLSTIYHLCFLKLVLI